VRLGSELGRKRPPQEQSQIRFSGVRARDCNGLKSVFQMWLREPADRLVAVRDADQIPASSASETHLVAQLIGTTSRPPGAGPELVDLVLHRFDEKGNRNRNLLVGHMRFWETSEHRDRDALEGVRASQAPAKFSRLDQNVSNIMSNF
jgi:hypothetical protein